MKKIIVLFIFIAVTIKVECQEVFYFYKEEKISFETNYNQLMVWAKSNDIEQVKRLAEPNYQIHSIELQVANSNIRSFEKEEMVEFYLVKLISSSSIQRKLAIDVQEKLNQVNSVVYTSFAIKNESKDDRFFSNQIFVKLKEGADIELLKAESLKFKTTILGLNQFMPQWITLLCDKHSIGKSNDIANALHDSKLFEVVEPDILNNFETNCSNDPLYGTQWFLNNTGQSGGTAGVDIKACNAWQVSTGNPDIITAVIDEGFEMNHPDLQANVFGTGFNTSTGSSPSVVFGSHGTQCAGLVSAVRNNNLGVSGVAPNSRIMSIAMNFNTLTLQQIANGINFAWQNGASVLSNSWGGGSPTTIITDAITNALNNGRNGLGCVVLFSSGNGNVNGAEFPSNSDPKIICVGAIDRCGSRSGRQNVISNSCDPWCTNCRPASSFGDPLDIVAGGTNTHTTDLQGTNGASSGDYDPGFGGTSAACPIVAGVAALILSVNPCLPQSAVHDIICKSGQKLPNFNFSNSSSRPAELGSWNNEVGHGLVNANICLQLAATMFLQNKNEGGSKSYLYRKIVAGKNVDVNNTTGDYNVVSGGNVTIIATETISLEDGFKSDYGSSFSASINPSAPCNHSNPVFKSFKVNELTSQILQHKQEIYPLISAYPNPTSDIVEIDYEVIENSKISIFIFDINGKELYAENFSRQKGIHKDEIAGFSSLQNNTYLLKICINNTCKSFKILKNESN